MSSQYQLNVRKFILETTHFYIKAGLDLMKTVWIPMYSIQIHDEMILVNSRA